MTLLEINAISKRYGPSCALDNVSLSIAAGSRTAIVGHSGSGKTTLLRVIAGFEAPDAGQVTLGGLVLADGPMTLPAHRRGIGFVPQDGALFPHLTVADNIGFGLPASMPQRAERIAELMTMVDLGLGMLKRRPHELSGGQQQRVALARALAQRPRIMLLDEPFSALDTGLRAATRKAVANLLSAEGIATILVTHDQAEALSFADQVAVLRGGRLVQRGTPMDLYLRPDDPDIASFLGENIILDAELGPGWADCSLGRISTNDGKRRGPAQIMLRPEQLTLAPASAGSPLDNVCQGRVTQVEFDGAMSTVRIQVLPADGVGADGVAGQDGLLVRCPAIVTPALGAAIQINVLGEAHVF